MKIIVAEDDERTADFIGKGLVENGHSVECYADGRDVLSHCLYNEFDVVVMDRMMPGMDGLSVVKSLRAAGIQTPVIFLTSMSGVDDRVDGLMGGGDDYLLKPFHFSELMARITALARRPRPVLRGDKAQGPRSRTQSRRPAPPFAMASASTCRPRNSSCSKYSCAMPSGW